ncbi:MAG: spore coat protein [bacterium]|jgi:spore coat protein CotF
MQLSNKEKMLLQDQKKHEEMCIQKYKKYAGEAQDPQLKQLFNYYASQEQQHYNTVNQILSGQTPSMGQSGQSGQSGQGQAQMGQETTAAYAMNSGGGGSAQNSADALMCQDMLATEKYISGTYDTSLFECTQSAVRQALNHIQKEEQQHGEGLFNYMQSHGMYNVQ